jgi:Xaa-Pro aminopeptidase
LGFYFAYKNNIIVVFISCQGVKTDDEIEGFKQCHIYDAIAKISFLCWLEEIAENEDILKTYTEYTVAQKLEEYRRLMVNRY